MSNSEEGEQPANPSKEGADDSWVLTPNDVRKILKCSRGVVYEGLRKGLIPSIRISPRKIIIPKRRFFEWLNQGGNNLHPEQ
jgi:hypothetical protein